MRAVARLSLFERTRVTRLLDEYCADGSAQANPARPRYVFSIRGTAVTLVEERRSFADPKQWTRSPIAQFRRAATSSLWTLYWRDRNGRWHLFQPRPGSRRLEVLLQVVEEDATCIFFG